MHWRTGDEQAGAVTEYQALITKNQNSHSAPMGSGLTTCPYKSVSQCQLTCVTHHLPGSVLWRCIEVINKGVHYIGRYSTDGRSMGILSISVGTLLWQRAALRINPHSCSTESIRPLFESQSCVITHDVTLWCVLLTHSLNPVLFQPFTVCPMKMTRTFPYSSALCLA